MPIWLGEKLVSSRVQNGGWLRMPHEEAESVLAPVIDAAIAGESWAYADLYERFAGRVRAFAASRRTEDPDGVANDVMLRVFQNLAGFEGHDANFESWVFTIARNRIIDAHRSAQRRPSLRDRPWSLEADDNEQVASAEDDALDALGLGRTARLLDLLTAEQREVVALRMVADLSLEQVAEIVDKPITAVKALQRRGLARLQREILDEEVS